MSHNDGNNVPVHTARIYRQSSLPTYEEATGILPVTDYTEIALADPSSPTANQQYIINIYNNHHGNSQTSNILNANDVSRNGDQERLIQENHIRAVDSLTPISLQARRRERVRKEKKELKLIVYIGAAILFCIFIMIIGMGNANYWK